MEKDIADIFKIQKGYLQSNQLSSRALHYQLKRMVDNGEVLMVKRGMYKHTLMANNNDWVEICRMVPNGVLCLFSAWHYYSLTTQVSLDYHMAIQHKSKLVLPPYPPVKLYYWSDEYYSLGKIEIISNSEKIVIYTIEKSVCDAIKFRNKVGMDITSEVLKNYLKLKSRNLDLLLKYAQTLRVENILNQYLKVML